MQRQLSKVDVNKWDEKRMARMRYGMRLCICVWACVFTCVSTPIFAVSAHALRSRMPFAHIDTPSVRDSIAPEIPFLRPSLRYGLDTTVSPCVDFDRFVNGGWRDSAVMPKGVESNNVFRFTSARTASFIQQLLDSTPTMARTTTDPVLRAVGRYYESCLRADSLERSIAALSMAGARRGDTSRAARCGRLVVKDLPDGAGRVFVNGLLPPQAEKRVRAMIANIQRVAEQRVNRLTWMDPAAKARVRKTLKTMTLRVAKPDVVVDHSGLELTTDDFEHNRQLIKEYLWKRQVVRTREEANALWVMNQYTANAQYQGSPKNTIEVPAFMFQWPFFDPDGTDDAMGYAGAGMIIGHEMYHGVTFSAAATRDSGYTLRANQLIAQYDSLPPIERVHVNGKISVTENLPDLGGLLAAYDAWRGAGSAKRRTMVEGFTPEQRFFLHYARVWRTKDTHAYVRRLRGDPHAPHAARINGVVANVPAFAKAFGCREGDPMAKSAAERVDIW